MSRLRRLAGFFDDRLGCRAGWGRLMEAMHRRIPRLSGWTAMIGAAALALVVLEAVTGIALSFHYQPTPEAARGSLAHIQDVARFGWILRGIHAWGSHALVALALVQAVRVFFTGAHKRPRELTWVVGVVVLFIVLGFAFTGHVLPWNNDAYWSTNVRIEHFRATPLVGEPAAAAIAGGSRAGGPTLARFYAMHVAALPLLLLAALAAAMWLVRRHGLTPMVSTTEEAERGHAACCETGPAFVPGPLMRMSAAATIVVGAVVTVAALFPVPAGAAVSDVTPPGLRPEWCFLALYQFLKLWPATVFDLPGEGIAICVVGAAILAFVLLPFIDRSPERLPGRRKVAISLGVLAVLAWVTLTLLGFVSGRTVEIFGKSRAFSESGLPK